MAWTSIDLPGAEVKLDPDWLPLPEADTLFRDLLARVPWETHRIRLFGRVVDSPRLSCWIGDPDVRYAYSGARFEPRPWPEALKPIRQRAGDACAVAFNSVLANLYRDGRDAMGWHRDDEPELGGAPVIASLSLGQPRRFLLKAHAPNSSPSWRLGPVTQSEEAVAPGTRVALELPHGSLLVMRGQTQRNFRHALPRTRKQVGPRINLTFRQVLDLPG